SFAPEPVFAAAAFQHTPRVAVAVAGGASLIDKVGLSWVPPPMTPQLTVGRSPSVPRTVAWQAPQQMLVPTPRQIAVV
ncbi:unnamed protein product, partial [Polarella glacialis]